MSKAWQSWIWQALIINLFQKFTQKNVAQALIEDYLDEFYINRIIENSWKNILDYFKSERAFKAFMARWLRPC